MIPTTQKTPTARPGRRAFLTAAAATGVAAAGLLLAPSAALAVSPPLKFSQIPGTGDVKVVNFALALEALEAELYRQAVARLTTGGVDNFGKSFAGFGLAASQEDVKYITEFAKVEVEHRNFLDATLGSQSLLRQAPFNKAKFEFGIGSLTRKQVVELVYTAEATGVTAYLGAIPFFQTHLYLPVAGGIQGVEARHTAVLADVLNDVFGESRAVSPLASQNQGRDMPVTPDKVLAMVSPFIVL